MKRKAIISNSLELVNNYDSDYNMLFTDSPFVYEKKDKCFFIEDILSFDKKEKYCDLLNTIGLTLNESIINSFLKDYEKSNNIYLFRPHVFFINLFIKCKSIDEITQKYTDYKFSILMDE